MTSALDLYALQRQFGGVVSDSGNRWSGPGPGHSRRDRSLSVLIGDGGRPIVHSFADDDWRTCAAYLGIEAARAPKQTELARLRHERQRAAQQHESNAVDFCRRVIAGAEPVEGTLGERYLQSRAIDWLPADVLFHGAAPRGYSAEATGPALLAVARGVGGLPRALQATFLRSDGTKIGRITFGALLGTAVRLSPLGAVLAVGEGLETCASFAKFEAISTWACLGTANLEAFRPPTVVRHLVIAADGDEAGMTSAHRLAERVRSRCDVTIMAAPSPFDWNDVVTGKARVF